MHIKILIFINLIAGDSLEMCELSEKKNQKEGAIRQRILEECNIFEHTHDSEITSQSHTTKNGLVKYKLIPYITCQKVNNTTTTERYASIPDVKTHTEIKSYNVLRVQN